MTQWNLYKRCPTCKASSGEPCEHLFLLTTKGKPVFMDNPHTTRKQIKAISEASHAH